MDTNEIQMQMAKLNDSQKLHFTAQYNRIIKELNKNISIEQIVNGLRVPDKNSGALFVKVVKAIRDDAELWDNWILWAGDYSKYLSKFTALDNLKTSLWMLGIGGSVATAVALLYTFKILPGGQITALLFMIPGLFVAYGIYSGIGSLFTWLENLKANIPEFPEQSLQ